METRRTELLQWLERVTKQTQVVVDSNNPSQLDLDLLTDYIKKFYDCLKSFEAGSKNNISQNHAIQNESVFEIKQVSKIDETNIESDIASNKNTEVAKSKEAIENVTQSSKTNHAENNNHFSNYQSIGDGFSEQDTVHTKISTGKTEVAVAEQLQSSPLTDLNDAIGINERFAFANVFMNGDINAFFSMLAQINSKTNFEEAYNQFKTTVIDKFNVDRNNKTYREFVELLQRRFAK
jgi:hypothetical protein